MKFYLDEDISPRVAVALRKRGIDAASAHQVGNTRLTDAEQLAFAATSGRCLVTRNARDFRKLGRDMIRRQESHAGIVVCSPGIRGDEIGRIVTGLIRMDGQFPAGLGEYDVIYLSRRGTT